MSKINEYPQAVTINNNDLFVIDQESGGDHATKSASVSQIADKATSGVQTQIGDLTTLTTSDKSSLVGAVNSLVLAVETYSTSFSLNNNTFASVDFTITKSGYRPIAVGTISSSGYTEICTYYFRNNNNGCRVNLGNHTGSNIIGGTLTITVIYAKS